MKRLLFSTITAALFGLAAAGCSTTPASPTVSFTSPLAAGPASGASYKFKSQPVTVSITNAVRTGTAVATYSVEVATDASFSNKVFTRDGIAEGSGSTTSVTLSSLTASSSDVTYYWRWRTTIDGTQSPYTAAGTFVIQQQIVVNQPSLVSPASGLVINELRPSFTIKNATRQGAVGAITYVFQLSRDAGFSNIIAQPTLPENFGGVAGQTTYTPSGDLPEGEVYWRAQARDDANTEASSFSSSQNITIEPFNPKTAQFWFSPAGVADWSETAKITSVTYNGGYMQVDFDRREGPSAWPEVSSVSFGPLQYSLGTCQKISGKWHCAAPIQFWSGRDLNESGPWRDIGLNWYYDSNRWGPLRQPDFGETIAIWVGQGNLRGSTGATYQERSNFQIVQFGVPYRR